MAAPLLISIPGDGDGGASPFSVPTVEHDDDARAENPKATVGSVPALQLASDLSGDDDGNSIAFDDWENEARIVRRSLIDDWENEVRIIIRSLTIATIVYIGWVYLQGPLIILALTGVIYALHRVDLTPVKKLVRTIVSGISLILHKVEDVYDFARRLAGKGPEGNEIFIVTDWSNLGKDDKHFFATTYTEHGPIGSKRETIEPHESSLEKPFKMSACQEIDERFFVLFAMDSMTLLKSHFNNSDADEGPRQGKFKCLAGDRFKVSHDGHTWKIEQERGGEMIAKGMMMGHDKPFGNEVIIESGDLNESNRFFAVTYQMNDLELSVNDKGLKNHDFYTVKRLPRERKKMSDNDEYKLDAGQMVKKEFLISFSQFKNGGLSSCPDYYRGPAGNSHENGVFVCKAKDRFEVGVIDDKWSILQYRDEMMEPIKEGTMPPVTGQKSWFPFGTRLLKGRQSREQSKEAKNEECNFLLPGKSKTLNAIV